MKKIILTLACLLAGICVVGAVDLRSGSFSPLAVEKTVGVEFDFSNVVIDGMTLQEFLDLGSVDEDYDNWDDFELFIKRRFMSGLNGEASKKRLDITFRLNSDQTPCRIIVAPSLMNISGEYKIDYILVGPDGEILGTAVDFGDGGTFGCFSNLMGDGFEEAAEDLAIFIRRQIRLR